MKRGQKIFFYSILLLLFIGAAEISTGQEQAFKSIQDKLTAFNRQAAREKVFLHTDKELYFAGEIIWFKIYCVDAVSLLPVKGTRITYVEVMDRNSKPVLQAKISLTEKGGAGSFYLPVSLVSDNYVLRAYTNFMKNDMAPVFYEKLISIVNTIRFPEAKTRDTTKVIANFFPEGGNLVQGIESKIAFRITDQNGRGINVNGFITNQYGDTVQSFVPRKFGIGYFLLKPEPGKQYKAVIRLNDETMFNTALPNVYEQGYVMNVTDNKDGRFRIRIQARGIDDGKRGENVFLLGHSRQTTRIAEEGFVNYETDLVFFVDRAKLDAGITHFTLFNKDQQPVCERLVFTRPKNKMPVQVTTDKTNYEARQPVNIMIRSDSAGSPMTSADYSIAVFRIDSLPALEQEDIESYLLLSSDLKGTVESPGYYFSGEAGADEAVDDLLLTHGWRRFKWEEVLSKNEKTPVKPAPHSRGQIITARVVNIRDQKPAAEVECFLSCPGTPFGFYTGKSDDKGMVQFDVTGYDGPGEIILQAGRDTIPKYRVDILTPFAENKVERKMPLLWLKKEEEPAITERSIAMQAQNIYLVDSIDKFRLPFIRDTFPFFGMAEYTYRLDEYKRFTTMEEVLREYVRPVNVVLRNGSLYMRVFDDLYFELFNDGGQAVYSDNILVLLDGVPLMNYNKIFSYDPLRIKKLDVVPRRFMMGGLDYKGIVSFESYKGKFDGFELTPGVVAVDYEGLQLRREFYSPVYETNEQRLKRMPDYRSTLYWTPHVPVDKNGQAAVQFYTSDLRGRFVVVLQGFNSSGEAVSATTQFTSN